ncbi:MAG: nuclear transport factor 2 family protein [Bacteroidota bacterium]
MTNIEVVKSFYRALDQGESDKAFDYLSEDFSIIQAKSLPYGGVFEGKKALGEFFQIFSQVWSSVKSENVEFYSEGEVVIVRHDFVGTGKSGKTLNMPMTQFYLVGEGRIQQAEPFYQDTHQILKFIEGQ